MGLILERKEGEVIRIGSSITIRVAKIKTISRKVVLVIEAPPKVKVLREEIYLAQQELSK